MNRDELLARLDSVIANGHAVLDSVEPLTPRTLKRGSVRPEDQAVNRDLAGEFRNAGLLLLRSLFGEASSSYRDFLHDTDNIRTLGSWRRPVVLLEAVRQDVQRAWPDALHAATAGDVLGELLDMAEEFLANDRKDAAAVITGSVLDGYLRTLAKHRSVETHYVDETKQRRSKPAQALNDELHSARVYVRGDRKQIAAWLDLRDDAAQGNYDEYTDAHVKLMVQGVRDFIGRVPA